LRLLAELLLLIENLAVDPRPDNCKKLKGQANNWRIKIGDYRVIYSVDDDCRIVEIIIICHRSQAYK